MLSNSTTMADEKIAGLISSLDQFFLIIMGMCVYCKSLIHTFTSISYIMFFLTGMFVYFHHIYKWHNTQCMVNILTQFQWSTHSEFQSFRHLVKSCRNSQTLGADLTGYPHSSRFIARCVRHIATMRMLIRRLSAPRDIQQIFTPLILVERYSRILKVVYVKHAFNQQIKAFCNQGSSFL